MKSLKNPHWFVCSRCGHERNEVIDLHRKPCLKCREESHDGHYFDQYDVLYWENQLKKFTRVVAEDEANEKLQKFIEDEIAEGRVGIARETTDIHKRMIPKCHDMIKKCSEHDYEA